MKARFKHKSFLTPSGKVLSCQGYEDKALCSLFSEFSVDENDLVVGAAHVPVINYKTSDGVQHRYFCDIFNKSTNTIIEVKSLYTYQADFEINNLKRDACLEAGYNFEFWIYSPKDERIVLRGVETCGIRCAERNDRA
jgi:hypothetical protein